VLHVLYLIFNEGYTSTAGRELSRQDLTKEAIRLTRTVHGLLPHDGEVTGLLALMLLIEARRAARTTADGALVPLAEQSRALWDPQLIEEGTSLITAALASGPVGPYQLQAAIAAVHAEAPSAEETDWPQILALYELLEQFGPNPVVTLDRAVAVAMVNGPSVALELLDRVSADERIARSHRLDAVRGHRTRWRATPPPRPRATDARRGEPQAFPNDATWSARPQASGSPEATRFGHQRAASAMVSPPARTPGG
jgi:predicted RNA polymerase sigma factor